MSDVKLGERSMYAYTVMTPRKKRSGLGAMCAGCCDRRPGAAADGHALKVYTDIESEIDSTWSILLTEEAQDRMRAAGHTSVHVHSRVTRAALMHVKYGGAKHSTHALDLTSDPHSARVRGLIEGCLKTAHPLDITMVDQSSRKLIVAWPLFDIRDVVVGVVWSARAAAIAGEKMNSVDRRRAAIHYDLTDNVLVLSHHWLLNHRTSFGELLNGDEDVTTVVLSRDLTVESVVHPEAAAAVFDDPTGGTLEALFDRRVLPAVTETIAHLTTADGAGGGTAAAAVTLDHRAYQFTVTKLVGITGALMGQVIKVQPKEQSLVASFVTTCSPAAGKSRKTVKMKK